MEKKYLEDIIISSTKKYNFYYEDEKRKIFKNEYKRSKTTKILIYIIISIVLVFITIIYPVNEINKLKNELEELSTLVEDKKEDSARVLSQNDYYEELRYKLTLLEESTPPDLYNRIARLAPYFQNNGIITSIIIDEENFQGHGVADNPLIIIERMRSDGEFKSILFEETVVDPDSGKDNFTLRGSFYE